MHGMTEVQAKLHAFLVDRIDDPVAPSYQEMADHLGLKSRSNINRILAQMNARGLVRWNPGIQRSVRAIRSSSFDGVPTHALIDELKRRGEWPHGG